MKILVLGGNGFVGSHLVDSLLREGHSVRVFDRGPEKFREPVAGVEYVYGDFTDNALLAASLSSIELVFHLISTTVPSTSNMDPVSDIQGNLVNTINLLELMRVQEVTRIIYLSSGGTVYGIPSESPIPESHSLNPINSYGVVKVAIEKYLHMYQALYGINYIALRASNPYGPRQSHNGLQGVIGTYISNIINDRDIEIWGDGSVIRDFIYIEDLVALCLQTVDSKLNGCFNAGSGEGRSLLQIVAELEAVIGHPIKPVFKQGRKIDVPHAVLDISLANKLFSWSPKIDLNTGLRLTLEKFREIPICRSRAA